MTTLEAWELEERQMDMRYVLHTNLNLIESLGCPQYFFYERGFFIMF